MNDFPNQVFDGDEEAAADNVFGRLNTLVDLNPDELDMGGDFVQPPSTSTTAPPLQSSAPAKMEGLNSGFIPPSVDNINSVEKEEVASDESTSNPSEFKHTVDSLLDAHVGLVNIICSVAGRFVSGGADASEFMPSESEVAEYKRLSRPYLEQKGGILSPAQMFIAGTLSYAGGVYLRASDAKEKKIQTAKKAKQDALTFTKLTKAKEELEVAASSGDLERANLAASNLKAVESEAKEEARYNFNIDSNGFYRTGRGRGAVNIKGPKNEKAPDWIVRLIHRFKKDYRSIGASRPASNGEINKKLRMILSDTALTNIAIASNSDSDYNTLVQAISAKGAPK